MSRDLALFVDVDFAREELAQHGKQMDYERLLSITDHRDLNFAYVSRDIGSQNIVPLEKFKLRLSKLGWQVRGYNINRSLGDRPAPVALMVMQLEYWLLMGGAHFVIITNDRNIIRVLDAMNPMMHNPIIVVGPAAWQHDPQLIQCSTKIVTLMDFCQSKHVLAVKASEWELADEFSIKPSDAP